MSSLLIVLFIASAAVLLALGLAYLPMRLLLSTMAKRVAAAAESAGAEVRLRHVAETHDPESFAHNPAWTANYEATKDLPTATGDDIVWADAVIFGSPTRFGSPAAQLRTFIDSLGGLWAEGKLAD